MRTLLLSLLLLHAATAQPPCTKGLAFGTALVAPPSAPPPIAPGAEAQACAWACRANARCAAFELVDSGTAGCAEPRGCCHFLAGGSWGNATWDAPGRCGALLRAAGVPPAPPPAPPPAGAKNVLHIIVDDLRPDLAPFGPAFMSTPSLAALAAESTLF